jgi:hypothetical protein
VFVDDTTEGNSKYYETTCPTVTLSAINPAWIDLVSKEGLASDRPANNGLRQSKAALAVKIVIKIFTALM